MAMATANSELTGDVDVFLRASREFLASRPVEHNLVLSLAEANRIEPHPSRWTPPAAIARRIGRA